MKSILIWLALGLLAITALKVVFPLVLVFLVLLTLLVVPSVILISLLAVPVGLVALLGWGVVSLCRAAD